MKNLLIITALILPLGIFAQGANTNPASQIQTQNINYYVQINNNENIIQTNFENQQANPQVKQRGGLGSLFGSNNTNETPCTDCDKVKKAIKLSHASSGGSRNKKSFSMKRWSKTASGKMNMKMKKTFARKHKVKSNFDLCFNWQ